MNLLPADSNGHRCRQPRRCANVRPGQRPGRRVSRRGGLPAALMLAMTVSIGLAGCDRPIPNAPQASAADVLKTGFPGQVSAGGGTSGEVMAASGNMQAQGNDQGTPGIPKGSGGTTGGAELGATQAGNSSIAGNGAKTPAQQPADRKAGDGSPPR